jgi:hypothetical protein
MAVKCRIAAQEGVQSKKCNEGGYACEAKKARSVAKNETMTAKGYKTNRGWLLFISGGLFV